LRGDRSIGSAAGGIILTNTRTLLRSDWIDASDGVRYPIYAVIYAVWAAALAYSIREYRANRDLEQQIVKDTQRARARPPRPELLDVAHRGRADRTPGGEVARGDARVVGVHGG
jgi:hypothetical protein